MTMTFERELYRACNILFGDGVDVNRDFLYYIQTPGIKSAYRKMAMETHPDRSAGVAAPDRFIETNWAYETLMEFISNRESVVLTNATTVHIKPTTVRKKRTAPSSARYNPACNDGVRDDDPGPGQNHVHTGMLPRRRLLFGQFLFYSGRVSWEAVIKAIVWQRKQRPRIGELARMRQWVTDHRLRYAIDNRVLGEQLGQAAIRLGILSEEQLDILIREQRRMHRPFGDFFVASGLMTRGRLEQLYREYLSHNSQYPPPHRRAHAPAGSPFERPKPARWGESAHARAEGAHASLNGKKTEKRFKPVFSAFEGFSPQPG